MTGGKIGIAVSVGIGLWSVEMVLWETMDGG